MGINVLSDSLKGSNKVEKTSAQKRKGVADGSENAAGFFAAMLSGSMNSNVKPKGQNSSTADKNVEGTQSAGDSVQLSLKASKQGNVLMGYGDANVAFPFVLNMLQEDIPAGKEANSGNGVSQEIGKGLTTDAQLAEVMAGLVNISRNLANSGVVNLNEISQVTDGNSLATTGMASLSSQGDNPAITELDKYKVVIAGLLEALSGEISSSQGAGTDKGASSVSGQTISTNSSSVKTLALLEVLSQELASSTLQGNHSSLESTETKNLSQDVGNVKGTTMLTDQSLTKVLSLLEELSGEASSTLQGGSSNSVSTAVKDQSQDVAKNVQGTTMPTDQSLTKALSLSEALATELPLSTLQGTTSSTGTKSHSQDAAKNVQDSLTLTVEGTDHDGQSSTTQKGIKSVLNVLPAESTDGNSKDSILLAAHTYNSNLSREPGEGSKIVKDTATALPANSQQKSEGANLQESKIFKNVQGVSNEDAHKGEVTQFTGSSEVNDVQNQSIGVGVTSNTLAANVADGRTFGVPVLEQISTVLREQVLNKQDSIKDFDIQLHPEDLGKIQIVMRWENGQVHIQVQASEAATGQLLQNHLSDLRHTLTGQGVNCGMLQMGQGGAQQQNNSHGNEFNRSFNQNTHPNKEEELVPTINPLSLEQDGINQINFKA